MNFQAINEFSREREREREILAQPTRLNIYACIKTTWKDCRAATIQSLADAEGTAISSNLLRTIKEQDTMHHRPAKAKT